MAGSGQVQAPGGGIFCIGPAKDPEQQVKVLGAAG